MRKKRNRKKKENRQIKYMHCESLCDFVSYIEETKSADKLDQHNISYCGPNLYKRLKTLISDDDSYQIAYTLKRKSKRFDFTHLDELNVFDRNGSIKLSLFNPSFIPYYDAFKQLGFEQQ